MEEEKKNNNVGVIIGAIVLCLVAVASFFLGKQFASNEEKVEEKNNSQETIKDSNSNSDSSSNSVSSSNQNVIKISGTYKTEGGTQGAYIKFTIKSDTEAFFEIKYAAMERVAGVYIREGNIVKFKAEKILDVNDNGKDYYRPIEPRDIERIPEFEDYLVFEVKDENTLITNTFADDWEKNLKLSR